MMGVLAAVFHFPPSEIDRLELHDFVRWNEQAKKVLDAAAPRSTSA